ncbi:helicase-related protein [Caulobacter sp. 17J80-11]|uniref:helicase-related protein n=1 Tax=Caulobacter sp. 17J80-11 TaxID=2763502 RepID=UPI001653CA15|nr:helicase-related protein [Caulobacter sp. 17J80-11]MBC6980371.1 phosphonate-binding protein [Caulobacter sp. 17J80-11]
MSDRSTGAAPSRLVAVLGPTNTGKTHLAVERMLAHSSGMIGLPLRLLAREVYDRIVRARGPRSVALITGEEKIVPPRPQYFVCTVEAMPLTRDVDFLAIDEIQLCADPARGHVFTQRLLHARGRHETMFLGAGTIAPLIRHLLPDVEIVTRERFSHLTYAGPKKLTRLPARTAVVAFSADQVYAIAELIRRQRGGAAVVMGSLSPRTRNAQVELYQSGEVDFLVATDAIGMGLNMDVDHVAFAGLRKFDGKRTRWLHAQEIAQIAGRAGRFRTDGTFGVTGDCPEMDEDLVEAVEEHRFQPVGGAEWRNSRLDFSSLSDLLRSLVAPPPLSGLKLSEEALDETTLRQLVKDEDIVAACRNRERLLRLWDVCQLPDFRKVSVDEHVRLVRSVFEHLTGPRQQLSDGWIAPQFQALDRTDGDIDALARRLANVRTLAYVANRPDWLKSPGHWQEKMRGLEDRLSDTLHERLMQRFIDRRTSVLMRALRVRDEVLAGVGEDGAVTVEGHYVGDLHGLHFAPAQGGSTLEDRALRAAAQRAVGPEVARRLGRIAAEPDEAFGLLPDGTVTWRGEAAAKIAGGRMFSPRVRLFGEMGPEPARARAAQRLEAWLAAEAGRRLGALKRLEAAVADGGLRGLPRGIAWRLVEAGGVLARREVEGDLKALSQTERRALKGLGVRIGAFSVWLPSLLKPAARTLAGAFAAVETPAWQAPPDQLTPLPQPTPSPRALSARGLRAVGGLAVPVEALERLDALLRAAPKQAGGAMLSDQARDELGWSEAEAAAVLRGLGYAPARKAVGDEPAVWRARQPKAPARAAPPPKDSPFAALAALKRAEPKRRRRPRRPAKPRASA